MQRILSRVACAMALLGLVGCHAPSDHPKTAMELKIYAVPAQQSSQLASALGNALGKTANVTEPAAGKLLVYAPRDAQDSIAATLASLGNASPEKQVDAQVEVHFWMVDALPGAGPDDATLKPLAPALDGLSKNLGPLHFQLYQSVSARTSVGNRAAAISTAPAGGYSSSFFFGINTVIGSTIDLWMDYEDHGATGLAKFKTQISTQSGHYVVLAQGPGTCAATLPGQAAPPCPVKPLLRLLVVRVDRLSPQS